MPIDPPKTRLRLFDSLRGFSVLSMVAFHLCYDLKYIAGYSLTWFEPPLQDVWRASISWTFLFVAGVMCSQSKNNLRRAVEYGLVALAILIVTSIAAVDTPISFGIMYCIFACTLVAWMLQRLGCLPASPVSCAVFLMLFLFCTPLSSGYVGLGVLRIQLPNALFQTPWLPWLGFPGPGFYSGDYYPLLPYLFMYLCGASFGMWRKTVGFPKACYELGYMPLEFVGRHALPIYVAHQPVILALIYVCGGLT